MTKTPDERRENIVSVRLTPAEARALHALGRPSDVIRRLLHRETTPPLPTGESVGRRVPMWWGEDWTGQTYPRPTT